MKWIEISELTEDFKATNIVFLPLEQIKSIYSGNFNEYWNISLIDGAHLTTTVKKDDDIIAELDKYIFEL